MKKNATTTIIIVAMVIALAVAAILLFLHYGFESHEDLTAATAEIAGTVATIFDDKGRPNGNIITDEKEYNALMQYIHSHEDGAQVDQNGYYTFKVEWPKLYVLTVAHGTIRQYLSRRVVVNNIDSFEANAWASCNDVQQFGDEMANDEVAAAPRFMYWETNTIKVVNGICYVVKYGAEATPLGKFQGLITDSVALFLDADTNIFSYCNVANPTNSKSIAISLTGIKEIKKGKEVIVTASLPNPLKGNSEEDVTCSLVWDKASETFTKLTPNFVL